MAPRKHGVQAQRPRRPRGPRALRAMIAIRDPDERARLVSVLSQVRPGARCLSAALDDRLFERAQRWVPALLIVDWEEPSVNAIELCAAIRACPELSGTCVLALTDEAVAAGDPAVALERKPVDARALAGLLERLLNASGDSGRIHAAS